MVENISHRKRRQRERGEARSRDQGVYTRCLYYLPIWPHTRFCLFVCLFVWGVSLFLATWPRNSCRFEQLALKCFFAFAWTLFFPGIHEGICFFQKQNFFKKLFLWPLNLLHHCLCRGEIFQCKWCDHENTSADTFTSTLRHVITSWPPQPHVFTLFLPPQVSRHTPQSWTEESHKTIR